MQKTHTPGPWAWNEGELRSVESWIKIEQARESDLIDCSYEEPIVETDGGYYGPREADRRLIAAAPLMLKALRGALPELEFEQSPATQLVRAAIQAATDEDVS